jgi:hypothetical protein
MPLVKDRSTPSRAAMHFHWPVKAGVQIFAGAIVMHKDGLAFPGKTGVGLKVAGRAERHCDNRLGGNGDDTVLVKRDCLFRFDNALGDEVDSSHVGDLCFVVDDATVAKTDGNGTRSAAGLIAEVDEDGVWVAL